MQCSALVRYPLCIYLLLHPRPVLETCSCRVDELDCHISSQEVWNGLVCETSAIVG
jgi:hypothetical protein